ncbi:hypothetical protein GCM10007094_40370 [Pseudovibrio japonicus]|uniref:Integral membrane protein n=1 Tax=Pseudovibrio japonicus TaxID=366534 RepID=A0ABQ3ERT6_9HYPH|nr:hypothetical protein [Pseudovibrio japonicus]GHB46918.1 hypothetical protein GCM10007094_40370 [Pseudovibrio japonicus]
MKRHVIYIPGYDPRPPEVAFSFFQTEIARYGDQRNVRCTLEETKGLDEGNPLYALWQVRSNQSGQTVDTDLYLINWRDLVLREFQFSGLMRILLGFWTFASMVFSGYYFRLYQRHLHSTLFWAYPPIFFAILVSAMLFPLGLLVEMVNWQDYRQSALAMLGFILWPFAIYRGSWLLERHTYFWYLTNDYISIRRYSLNKDVALRERLESVGQLILQIQENAAPEDEVIVLGHSSGSMLVVDAIHEALCINPDLGTVGAKIRCLTLGSAFNYFCGFSGSTKLRTAIAELTVNRAIHWRDVYASEDIICNGKFPSLQDFTRKRTLSKNEGPEQQRTRIAASLTPERYRALWGKVFNMHFCYLLASDNPGYFDLYEELLGFKEVTAGESKEFALTAAPSH